MGRKLRFENGRVVNADDPRNGFTCDGCGEHFAGAPAHTYEGLPFKTYCSDECVPNRLLEA